MKLWLFGTLAFGVAAFVDGTMRRKIKAAAAGFASPLSFHVAAHGMMLLVGATVILLIAPIALLPEYWVAGALLLSLLLWRAAASYQ
jgi:hypothetical protein